MPEYRLSPAAERDLADIWHYTSERWGKEQANRYTLGLKVMFARLAETPLWSQDCSAIRPDYRRRSVERHAIYFRQTGYGIAIIRILHLHMDPSRHL